MTSDPKPDPENSPVVPQSATGTEQPANATLDSLAPATVTEHMPEEPEDQRQERATSAAKRGGVSYLYLLAAFVVVTAGVRMAQEILQLLLLSIFLAVVCVPVYAWLIQKKIASWLSLLIVISGLMLSTLVVFWIVMTSMADFTSQQDHYADQLRERTRPLQGMLEKLIPETPVLRRSILVPESSESPEVSGTPTDDSRPVRLNEKQGKKQEQPGPVNVLAAADPTKDSAASNTPSTGAPDVPEVADPSDASTSSVEESRVASSQHTDETAPLNPDDAGSTELILASSQTESESESMFDPKSESATAWLQPRKVMVPPLSRRGWRELIASQFDPARVMSMAASLAFSVSQILSNTLLILLTVVFILLEASTFPKKLRMAFGENRDTQERYGLIVARIRSYLVIKTVMSLLTGLLIASWLWLFGVPYAGLWGMLAFLLNYIPNIGSIIAAIPAVMVAWLDLGLLVSIAASVGYVVVNMGVGNFLEPRVLGRGMGLSALVVFCSMIFWGWALGPIGMLLSVPLTMTARVAFEGFEDTRWLGTLLGDAE